MIINEKKKTAIPDDSILYIEASINYSIIHRKHRTKPQLLIAKTIKSCEHKLGENFIRISQKYLVNVNHIDQIFENQVHIDGKGLPISRRNLKSVKRLLNKD